jgi:hypothetical protein
MQLVGFNVLPRRIHEPALNINCYHVPEDDPGVADLDGRVSAELERGMCIGQARRLGALRRLRWRFLRLLSENVGVGDVAP